MAQHSLKATLIILLFILLLALSACERQSRGFALPEGDAKAGRETFLSLECNHCHSVVRDVEKASPGHPEIAFQLGGQVTRIKSYGDLVTSIINPSHRIAHSYVSDTKTESGESRMSIYNEVMTIQQLVDLTTYLQDSYEVVRPQYQAYYYGP